MSDLVSRLLTAIEAEEQDAPNIHHKDCRSVSYVGVTEGAECDCGKPAAVLRRCAADKALLELHRPNGGAGDCQECFSWVITGQYRPKPFPCPTVLLVAQAYGLSVEEETTHE